MQSANHRFVIYHRVLGKIVVFEQLKNWIQFYKNRREGINWRTFVTLRVHRHSCGIFPSVWRFPGNEMRLPLLASVQCTESVFFLCCYSWCSFSTMRYSTRKKNNANTSICTWWTCLTSHFPSPFYPTFPHSKTSFPLPHVVYRNTNVLINTGFPAGSTCSF